MSSKTRAFSNVRHFTNLSEEVLNAMADRAIQRCFETDQVIYLEGEPATALYILEKGWVKAIRLSRQGREQAIMVFQPGEVFGDVAVFTGEPYPGTVLALEPVVAWAIQREDVMDLIARYPEMALAIIHRLGERIMYFVGLVEDLSLRSVESRLAHTLLRYAQLKDGRLVVPRRSWATIDKMAARLGTVRDVLGRILRTLEDEGVLQIERDQIVILNSERLTELGEI